MYEGCAESPKWLRRGDDGADDGREAEIRFSKLVGGCFAFSADADVAYEVVPCKNSELCEDVRRKGFASKNEASGWVGIGSTSVIMRGPRVAA